MKTQGKYLSLVRHLGKRFRLRLRILHSLRLHSTCERRLHLRSRVNQALRLKCQKQMVLLYEVAPTFDVVDDILISIF